MQQGGSLTLGNLVTCTPSLTDDGRAGAAVGGTASSLWFKRRRSGKGESVVARVSRMSAAIVVIVARADMTVRIPCRGIKDLDLLPAPRMGTQPFYFLFARCDSCSRGTASFFSLCGECRGELLGYRHVLQLHLVMQAVLERRIGFTDDKRGQVAASRLRDTKATSADKVAGQQLLP